MQRFTQGEFEFGAEASAVARAYNNGMAIFTVVKGGLMCEAVVAGQKFKFKRGI